LKRYLHYGVKKVEVEVEVEVEVDFEDDCIRLGNLANKSDERKNTPIYCTVLYCAVLYCTVLYSNEINSLRTLL
jgi:hypothetical protein